MSKDEEIKRLEDEIKNTQYNKATERHIGRLKAKLARLKDDIKKSKSPRGYGFFIKKAGDSSVAIIGPPSVGKSTLLNILTNAQSKVGDYSFTTTDIIPGIMEFEGFNIQILDLPGLIYGASEGKGRGKEIIAMTRVVDLLLILVDIDTITEINFIKQELYKAGIRINKNKPDISIKRRDRNGITVECSKRCKLDSETVKAVISEYMSNADVIIRDDITVDDLIDKILENRVYLPAFIAVNKSDIEENIEIKNEDIILISAKEKINIEKLKNIIIKKLNLIRIYLNPEGNKIEEKPMVLKKGATIENVCKNLHKDFIKNFKFAILNGPSSAFPYQRVGLSHKIMDGDIITIVTH